MDFIAKSTMWTVTLSVMMTTDNSRLIWIVTLKASYRFDVIVVDVVKCNDSVRAKYVFEFSNSFSL